jgi:hypothetical protein
VNCGEPLICFRVLQVTIWLANLRLLKLILRAWNEEMFGNIERKKQLLSDDSQVLDGLEEGKGLNEEITRRLLGLMNWRGQFF